MDLDELTNPRYQPTPFWSMRDHDIGSILAIGRSNSEDRGLGKVQSPGMEIVSSMVACDLRLIVLLGIWLAGSGQVEPARSPRTSSTPFGSQDPRPVVKTVVVSQLDVYDQANEKSYRMGTLSRGNRVKVRQLLPGGWVAIDPPSMAIGWIARSALDLGHESGMAGSRTGLPVQTRVAATRTVVRSGHVRARLPGPPWVQLRNGALVRLVDRPPLTIGQGDEASLWFAIVPPDGAVCYIRSEGIEEVTPPSPPVAERLAGYLADEDSRTEAGKLPITALPADVGVEIRRLDAMHQAILVGQPIEQWRFENVRAGYQDVLKRAGDNPVVEEALRDRLARLTRHEQAAQAARTIQSTLVASRRRDIQVAQLRQRLIAADQARTRTYNAIGFVQPSSREVDGRKLHALIGSNGSTLAYLDIPPGIDVKSFGVRRVGILGVTHYDQDLGARLITVRDLEAIEARR